VIAEKSFAEYYPLNFKAIELLENTSEELKNTSFGGEVISQEDIFKILLTRLKSELVPFPGSPLKGLQVLGFLESRSLNFENVIILNANETILPKLKMSEPLIPREVMFGLGINRVEKEEEIQRYEFFRLINGAKNAHIIYSASEENERSRFIEELIWEKEKKDKNFRLKPKNLSFRSDAPDNKRSFNKYPEIVEYLKTMKYSATSVNTYLNCPLQFYFRHVLKIKEKETYKDEPGGSEIGKFIHNFLYKKFSTLLGSKPVYDEVFEKDFYNLLEQSFNETFLKRMGAGAYLLKEVIFHRMGVFLEKEKERNPKKIAALEKTYQGTIVSGQIKYYFESRIDRLDELEDGSFLILDYKTGGINDIKGRTGLPENMEFSRETIRKYLGSLQLPIYIKLAKMQMPSEHIDAALYDMRSGELIQFFKDAGEEEREDKTQFCTKSLEYIIAEINNPSLPFTPDDSNSSKCSACPYFYACR